MSLALPENDAAGDWQRGRSPGSLQSAHSPSWHKRPMWRPRVQPAGDKSNEKRCAPPGVLLGAGARKCRLTANREAQHPCCLASCPCRGLCLYCRVSVEQVNRIDPVEDVNEAHE